MINERIRVNTKQNAKGEWQVDVTVERSSTEGESVSSGSQAEKTVEVIAATKAAIAGL